MGEQGRRGERQKLIAFETRFNSRARDAGRHRSLSERAGGDGAPTGMGCEQPSALQQRGLDIPVPQGLKQEQHGAGGETAKGGSRGEGKEEIPAERLEQGWGGGGRRGRHGGSSQCLLIFCLAALGATAPRSWSRSTLY